MSNAINIAIDIDLDKVNETIAKAQDLNSNDEIFAALAEVSKPKHELEAALEAIEAAEREAKQAISDKARALYGNEWKAIAGNGYKITRSFSGAVYEGNGPVDDKFLIIKQSIDSKAVTDFVKGTGHLPEGVTINEHRNEVLRLTIKEQA